jgi:hypothetical protein
MGPGPPATSPVRFTRKDEIQGRGRAFTFPALQQRTETRRDGSGAHAVLGLSRLLPSQRDLLLDEQARTV